MGPGFRRDDSQDLPLRPGPSSAARATAAAGSGARAARRLAAAGTGAAMAAGAAWPLVATRRRGGARRRASGGRDRIAFLQQPREGGADARVEAGLERRREVGEGGVRVEGAEIAKQIVGNPFRRILQRNDGV